MKLLIVGAMESEITNFRNKLLNYEIITKSEFTFYIGKVVNNDIILVRSGIGRTMAGVLIGVAMSTFEGIDKIINVGIAGGVFPTKHGDVIVGSRYCYGDVDLSQGMKERYGQMANCPRLFHADLDLIKLVDENKCFIGDICTCDSFTTSLEKVNYLSNTYFNDLNILCFDMESTAFAHAAYFYSIPFLAIRVISDVIGNDNQSAEYKENELSSSKRSNDFLFDIIKKIS